MLAAAFTLLPALLSLLGERAFWPTRSAGQFRGSEPTRSVEKEPRNGWGRVAGLVRRRSRAIILAVFGLLIVLALGNLTHHGTIGFGQGETEADQLQPTGPKVLGEHFPPGIGSPLTAVVRAGRGRRRSSPG